MRLRIPCKKYFSYICKQYYKLFIMKHLPPSALFTSRLVRLLASIFVLLSTMVHAQNNTSCQTAAVLTPVTTCNTPQQFTFTNGQTEQWFSFMINNNVSTLYSFLSIQDYFTGNNSIFSLEFYTGNCGMLSHLTTDILQSGDSNLLSLFDSLNNNTVYYIKVIRTNQHIPESFSLCLQIQAQQFSVEINGNVCTPLNPSSCYIPIVKNCTNFYTACLEESLTFYPDAYFQNSLGDFIDWRIADNNYNVIYGPVTTYTNGNGSVLDPFTFIPSSIPLSSNNTYWVVASYYNYLPNFGYYCFWTEIQMEIHIIDKPYPAFTISPPPPYCINQQIFLTDATTNHPGGIDIWDMGDGGAAYGYGASSYTYITPGIYTITYTKSNVCGENTITQEIVIGPYPKFEVPNPLCAGQAFTFTNTTACLQYVQSWFWDFGDGNISTQHNPSHTYVNPGIYMVQLCLTDANGQQHCITELVEVHPSPAAPIILGNLFVCDPQAIYCVQNPQPGLTYQWDITNGTPITATGPCVNVQWNQNTNAFITLTATNEYGCIALTEKEVAECCYKEDNGTEINLYNSSASFVINNILGGSTNWTTNTYININGYFQIDQDFTISACPNIFLGQNAYIEIQNNVTLRIDNGSVLQAACPDKMWDGIYLKHADSELEADFATFMHAQQAVVSELGAKYTISACTFDQNWISLYVKPYPFAHSGTVTAGAFGPTQFLCTAPLMYPHTGKRSHAGVRVESNGWLGGSILIGSSLLFDNQNTGIYATASNLVVKGNTFQNMGILPFQGGGIGVYSNGSDLQASTLVGGNAQGKNDFNNCYIGVLTEGWQQAEISYNKFTGTNNTAITGIRVQHITKYGQPIPFKNITIKNNTITNYQTGISLYSNMNAKVLVEKNTINQQNIQFGSGIVAQEMPISITFNLTTIKQNTITAPATGIHASGLTNALIEDNTVSKLKQFPLFNTYGVLLRACNSARVRDNSVSSQQPSTNTRQHGYAFEMSEATFATCNEANKTGTGMRCAGAMPSTNLWGNTFKQNHTGFVLSNNGLIGPQYRPGNTPQDSLASDNKWIGNFTYGTHATISTDGRDSPIYRRNQGNYVSPLDVQTGSSEPIKMRNAEGSTYKCVKVGNPGGIALNALLKHKIAKKQILFTTQQDTAIYLTQQAMYLAFKNDSALISDNVLQQFTDSVDTAFLGDVYAIYQATTKPLVNFSQLAAQCNNLICTNNIEHTLKKVQQIWLKLFESNWYSIDSADKNYLQTLAVLCPFEEGYSVYQARMILSFYDTTEYQNNCEEYINNNQRIPGNNNDAENIQEYESEIVLTPNPAQENMSIYSTDAVITSVIVYNILGEKVYESFPNSIKLQINVSSYPNGIYHVFVKANNKQHVYKIAVVH